MTLDGTCNSALRKIVLGITDFMVSVLGDSRTRNAPDPHMGLSILAWFVDW